MKFIYSILFTLLSFCAFSQGPWGTIITTGGSANTYTGAIIVPTFPGSYTAKWIEVKFHVTNTGASTININSIGAIPLRMWDGDSWEVLTSGQINVDTEYRIKYFTGGNYFQMESFGAGSTLTNGNGTTAAGSAVGLGGTVTGNITLSDNNTHSFVGNSFLSATIGATNGTNLAFAQFTTAGASIQSTISGNNSELLVTGTDLKFNNKSVLVTRNNLAPSVHTSSFTLAPSDTSKMHILSGGSGAIVITMGTFSSLSGKGLQFAFRRDRADTVYFDDGSETLIPGPGGDLGMADSTFAYLYYNGTTDRFYLSGGASGSSGGGGSGTVESVTGDGVDNTDPANPVLTFPTTVEIGAQPLDSDITAIAGLSASNDDIIQRKSGAWTNRTLAQYRTDLALVVDAITDGVTSSAPTQNATFDGLALKLERAYVANNQAGNYTVATADFTTNTTLFMNNSSTPRTLTIPLNSSDPIPLNIPLLGRRTGTEPVTFAGAGGVTVTSTSGGLLDPGQGILFAITKTATNTWFIDNGASSLGAANTVFGVNPAGTASEYKVVGEGLTSGATSLVWGGAITSDKLISGAFNIGFGATASAKLHIRGIGTTTGTLLRAEDSGATARLTLLDNGSLNHVASFSGANTGFGSAITGTSTANSQTHTYYSLAATPVPSGFTGQNQTYFRVWSTAAGNGDFLNITNSSMVFSNMSLYDFRSTNSSTAAVIRNSQNALILRGAGAAGTRMLQFDAQSSGSVNNNAAFNFTSQIHEAALPLTRTWTEFLNDATITSVNGSTITYTIWNNNPTFSLGTSTLDLVGEDYNPAITSGTLTHVAKRIRIGLSGFGVGANTIHSTLQSGGSFAVGYVAKTANYTLTVSDYLVDCTANSFTITLPTAVGITGRTYVIANTGVGTITMATTSSQTIDGVAPGSILTTARLRVTSNGANWITW